jgi:hypothetical protein
MTNNNGFWIGNRFWIGWLDLLTPSFTITLTYNQLQQLTINDCLRLNPFWLDCSCLLLWLTWFWFTNHTSSINDLRMKNECILSLSLMLRPTVSLPVCLGIKHPSGAYDQIFIIALQLRVCWSWAPSLTRGRVCRLQFLLALTSAVIFGSESRRTRGHILLSQIRDFPFRRLLRLAGSRWRHSTLPPHGYECVLLCTAAFIV